jgi:hypothetical protein
LLYATILNTLAGTVTGSIFKVQTILVLLGLVIIESIILCFMQGSIVALWAFANVVGIEFGYFAGIFARSFLEHAPKIPRHPQARQPITPSLGQI